MSGTLTIDTLYAAMDKGSRLVMLPPSNIIVSEHALKDSDERLFPESKNRSRRIHKKLVKRFGGVFRKVPCSYQTPQGIIMHPAMYAEFQAEMERRTQHSVESALLGNPIWWGRT
jgi:hypothetical protein